MEKIVEKSILDIFMLLFDEFYYMEYSSVFININDMN